MPPGVSSGNVLMFTTNYYCQPPSSSKPLLLSKLWQVKRWELKTKTWNSACLSPSEKDCFNRPLYILPCFHLNSGGFVRRHFRHCFKILSPSPRQNMKWLYLDVGFLVTTQTLCLSQRCLRKWGLKQPSPSFLEDTLYAVLKVRIKSLKSSTCSMSFWLRQEIKVCLCHFANLCQSITTEMSLCSKAPTVFFHIKPPLLRDCPQRSIHLTQEQEEPKILRLYLVINYL